MADFISGYLNDSVTLENCVWRADASAGDGVPALPADTGSIYTNLVEAADMVALLVPMIGPMLTRSVRPHVPWLLPPSL